MIECNTVKSFLHKNDKKCGFTLKFSSKKSSTTSKVNWIQCFTKRVYNIKIFRILNLSTTILDALAKTTLGLTQEQYSVVVAIFGAIGSCQKLILDFPKLQLKWHFSWISPLLVTDRLPTQGKFSVVIATPSQNSNWNYHHYYITDSKINGAHDFLTSLCSLSRS